MNCSARSHPDMVLSMLNPEAVLHISHDPSFEMVRNDPYDDVPLSALEAALNRVSVPTTAGVAATVHTDAPGKIDHRPIESLCTDNDDGIAREVKYALKQLIGNELRKILEESLNDILRMSFHNAQKGIFAVGYIVFEQVTVPLLPKEVIEDTLDAHIANSLDTDVATDKPSRSSLTFSPFMVPIVTSVGCKTDTDMESMKYSTSPVSKEMMESGETYSDESEPPPSRLESGSEEPSSRKSLRSRSKPRHKKRKDKDAKWHSFSSKSLKEKCDSHLESELDRHQRSTLK